MVGVISRPDTHKKLQILSSDAQYDLACACGDDKQQGRKRSEHGKWIYPVTLPNGGKSLLFKTLISNSCANDCKYCPLRAQNDTRRCSLTAEETVKVFLDYYYRKEVFGLFLSSASLNSPDNTMEKLNQIARVLRKKHAFKGYIHLKIIPGASNAAIAQALSFANAVSINIETPGAENLAKLSNCKNYITDIIEPIKLISRLTSRGNKYERVKQTTQFIVGAAQEKDAEIVKYLWGLYDRLKLQRVYFSAYQKGLGDPALPGEQDKLRAPADVFMREHRLYQIDFLFRKYGFSKNDIVFDDQQNLSLDIDPKLAWAQNHPEQFPVYVNKASKFELLKVPGLGPITVNRILKQRNKYRINSTDDIGPRGLRLKKAQEYLAF